MIFSFISRIVPYLLTGGLCFIAGMIYNELNHTSNAFNMFAFAVDRQESADTVHASRTSPLIMKPSTVISAARSNYNELDIDSVFYLLQVHNIPYPEVWIRVARCEAGFNLDSRVARENRNIFGMSHPLVRSTTSKRSINGYAHYNTVEDAIVDLKLRIEHIPFIDGEDCYQYLRRTHWNPKGKKYTDYLQLIRISDITSSVP